MNQTVGQLHVEPAPAQNFWPFTFSACASIPQTKDEGMLPSPHNL